MATILKIPTNNTKGVLTFTTPERDKIIFPNSSIQDRLRKLKKQWVIGLHHNWQDHYFKYNDLFDFSLLPNEDMVHTKNQEPFPFIKLQCANFSPPCFLLNTHPKFWDILHVSRAQKGKGVLDFFKVIRVLYDQGKHYRVLLICPIPPHNPNRKDFIYNLRDYYNKTFSFAERERFTLLTTNFRYPYPFDIETLAHFYHSSKILMNSGKHERQGRVNSYAWACGMPVVALEQMGDQLSKHLRESPILFGAKKYADFPDLVIEAINYCNQRQNFDDFREVSNECSEHHNIHDFKLALTGYCGGKVEEAENYSLKNLDRRLGRHHGFGDSTNGLPWALEEFLEYIENRPISLIKQDINHPDPERNITDLPNFQKGQSVMSSSSSLFIIAKTKKLIRLIKQRL
ncbi:MAG: hypothetical protein ACPGRW_08135 [Flavobacteriaceae bacterium]